MAGQVDQQKIKYYSQSMGDPHNLSATFKREVKYINLDHYGLVSTAASPPYKPTPGFKSNSDNADRIEALNLSWF